MTCRQLILYVTVMLATSSTALAAGVTNWTGGGGNSRWDNAANWSNGVPDAATFATFYGRDGTFASVDLGGVTRRAGAVSVGTGIGSLIRITNGTLSTRVVEAISDTEILSSLTTDGPTLELHTNGGFLLNIRGPIVGSMDVVAAGKLQGISTYTGRTFVRRSLEISGDASLLNTPVVEVSTGTLTLNSNVGFSIAQGVLELRGGRVIVAGEDRADRMALASGGSLLELRGNFRTSGLSRAPGATLVISQALAGTTFTVGTAPTAAEGVAPWMTMAGESFGVYDQLKFRPLAASEYSSDLAAGSNARLTGARTQSSNVDVNTLTLDGASLQLEGAELRLGGGGLMFQSPGGTSSIRGTGSLALPSTDGVVHTFGAGAAVHTVDVPVTGGMLTKSGPARLRLTRDNSFAGGTTINQGTVVADRPGSLGTGPIRFSGGNLVLEYAGGTLANDLILATGTDVNDPSASLGLRPGTTTLSGRISGNGQLRLIGGNTILSGGGAAEGKYQMWITGGTAMIEGSYASPDSRIGSAEDFSAVGGNGTLRGVLRTVGSIVSPGPAGAAPGRLTIGGGEFYGSTLQVDIAGPDAGVEYDQLVVLDSFFLRTRPYVDNDLEVRVGAGFIPAAGDRFTIIDNRFTGPIDGYFDQLPEGAVLVAGSTLMHISYFGGDGNDVVLTVVPEPQVLALLALAAVTLVRRRR